MNIYYIYCILCIYYIYKYIDAFAQVLFACSIVRPPAPPPLSGGDLNLLSNFQKWKGA